MKKNDKNIAELKVKAKKSKGLTATLTIGKKTGKILVDVNGAAILPKK